MKAVGGESDTAWVPLGISTRGWSAGEPNELSRVVWENLHAGVSLIECRPPSGAFRVLRRILELHPSWRPELALTWDGELSWVPSQHFSRLLRSGLAYLGVERYSLCYLPEPRNPRIFATQVQAMAREVAAGRVEHVGVAVQNREQLERALGAFAELGLPIFAVRRPYNLLDRTSEVDGTLAACHSAGVRFFAQHALARGLLTGRYGPHHPRPGLARLWDQKLMTQSEPLLEALRQIAFVRSKAPAQVALNWVSSKGATPVVGTRTPAQARQNLGSLGWRLSPEEIATLDRISAQIYAES